MERNYDEIIADILIQLDTHTQELTNQSRILTKQSHALEKQSQLQGKMNEELITRMDTIHGHLLEQLVHSATILDRIIKKNKLKV